MKAFKLTLMTVAAIAAAATTSACSEAETGTSEEARLRSVLEAEGGQYVGDLEALSSTKDDEQGNHSASSCCWGHCNTSGPFHSALITSGCRDWVIDICHMSGMAFNPNGDAWWGTCP